MKPNTCTHTTHTHTHTLIFFQIFKSIFLILLLKKEIFHLHHQDTYIWGPQDWICPRYILETCTGTKRISKFLLTIAWPPLDTSCLRQSYSTARNLLYNGVGELLSDHHPCHTYLWRIQSCPTLGNPPAPLSMGFSSKNTTLCCHTLPQGIFLTQGSNPHPLCLLHWQAGSLLLAPSGKPLAFWCLSTLYIILFCWSLKKHPGTNIHLMFLGSITY